MVAQATTNRSYWRWDTWDERALERFIYLVTQFQRRDVVVTQSGRIDEADVPDFRSVGEISHEPGTIWIHLDELGVPTKIIGNIKIEAGDTLLVGEDYFQVFSAKLKCYTTVRVLPDRG
jgi:hypothetical protein